jgi:hypothetical protein
MQTEGMFMLEFGTSRHEEIPKAVFCIKEGKFYVEFQSACSVLMAERIESQFSSATFFSIRNFKHNISMKFAMSGIIIYCFSQLTSPFTTTHSETSGNSGEP